MNKKLIFLFIGIFLFSFVNAQRDIYYELDNDVDLNVVCLNAGYCSSSAQCNISVFSPSGQVLLPLGTMQNQNSFHNYTLNSSLISSLGTYNVGGYCKDGASFSELDFPFEVTLSGGSPNIWSYITLIAILSFSLWALILFNINYNYGRREQLYKKVVTGYFSSEHGHKKGNLGSVILSALGLSLLKNMFIFYYLWFTLFLFLMVEFGQTFFISSLTSLASALFSVVIWGFLFVFAIMVFTFYNLFRTMMDDISKLMLGASDGW